jgi:hypothetical protein
MLRYTRAGKSGGYIYVYIYTPSCDKILEEVIEQ